MSKLVVDKLPNGCDECPFLFTKIHPRFGNFLPRIESYCPLKKSYPDCLDRFIELKELINAKTKEVK